MKKLFLSTLLVLTVVASTHAQEEQEFTPIYKYRICLKDKKGTAFSVKHPEKFLSQKSIERRRKQKLKVNKTDLPVSQVYLNDIQATGVTILSTSKWNNTVLVQTTDTTLIDQIAAFKFVTNTKRVAIYTKPEMKSGINRFSRIVNDSVPRYTPMPISTRYSQYDSIHNVYGLANRQIEQINGAPLHEKGYRGKGMTIAVIDGGFYNADIIPMLKDVNILGTKDFVTPGGNVYENESHGMMVLSCMATNSPNLFVGTAPEASYWLLRSEDGGSEQIVEEDNWAAAIEFADSVGADVVNTSLGYSILDRKEDNVKYWEMDGHQHISSNSASMMASKGMILCNSAGNEASKAWKLISVPADAEDVLTVGAVTPAGVNTLFSSLGNSSDGRIKPDVMSQGEYCTVMNVDGTITHANGTSFASPILCGMVACYWQANPKKTAHQIMEEIRQRGNNVEHPNNVFGYGIPDFGK